MALTRITKGVIKPNENYDTHDINSTGIITATGANITGNMTVGGVLTYEDVTSIDSVGLITARNGIDCNGDLDVDGHTNLDNVSIAGVTTTSTVNFATNARANFASNNRLSIHSNGTNSYLDYGGSLNVRGSSGSAAALSFLSDSNVLVSNSLSINDDLDVDGHTNLDNVSISGVTTASNFKSGSLTVTSSNATINLTTTQVSFTRKGEINHFHNNGSTAHNKITLAPRNGSVGRIIFSNMVGGTLTERLRLDGNDGIQPSAHIVPMTDSTYNLGSNGLRFANVYADTLYGDGSNLTGISGVTINNNADNRIITGSGTAATLNGESKLTFDGTNLRVDQGNSSDGIVGQAYSGYFGLKHADQTYGNEYMILSNDGHTYISASAGSHVYIRSGNNDNTNQLIVATGATGLTWRGNTVWTAENDGAGSGLNADTVDGVHGSSFLRSDAGDSFNNTLTYSGSAGGVPIDFASNDGYPSVRVIRNNTSSGSYADGMYIGYSNQNNGVTRIYGGGATTGALTVNGASDVRINGNTVFHAGNDGSGSGLDSDTVDGIHASSFLRSDAADTSSGTVAFGVAGLDPDSYTSYSGGFGGISDGGGWSARGVFVHGGGTGDAAAMAHNGNKLYFGIQDGSSTNSMATWLDVTPNTRVINFQTANNTTNLQCGGNKIFHAGNDGSGSGLDADLLDGAHGSSYLRSDADDTATHRITFENNQTDNHDDMASSSAYLGGIEIRNSGVGNDAFMAFHAGSDYAFYFGLDADTNKLAVGGWSMGANKYAIYHEGNKPTESDLGFNYLSSNSDDVATHRIVFQNCATDNMDTIATSSGSQGGIEIYNQGSGNDAFMAFHAGSDYALYFGLDADTNRLAVGGWSMGNIKPSILHERYATIRGSSAGDGHGIRISMDGNPAPASVGHNSTYPEGIFWHSNTTNYGIYRTAGNWSGNYQQLRIDWLTGIILDGGSAYGLSGVRFDCHSMPTTDNTYDLGTSSLRFRNVYTNDLAVSGTLTVGGAAVLTAADLPSQGTKITATGGNSTSTVSGHKVHDFQSNGTFEITAGAGEVEVLIVGGGGSEGGAGSGCHAGGGGGGGGVVNRFLTLGVGKYAVVIGAGGLWRNNGGNSSAFGLVALGGGAGGPTLTGNGNNGGSGGGSSRHTNSNQGGNATQPSSDAGGLGNNGGGTGPTNTNPGGGGGAGGAGTNGNGGGIGGAGKQFTQFGVNIYFGAGGNGNTSGGSQGQTQGSNHGAGNTGAGAGGSSGGGTRYYGGSGRVMIRYPV